MGLTWSLVVRGAVRVRARDRPLEELLEGKTFDVANMLVEAVSDLQYTNECCC